MKRVDRTGQLLISFLRPRAPKERQHFNPALTNAKELSIFIASKILPQSWGQQRKRENQYVPQNATGPLFRPLYLEKLLKMLKVLSLTIAFNNNYKEKLTRQ